MNVFKLLIKYTLLFTFLISFSAPSYAMLNACTSHLKGTQLPSAAIASAFKKRANFTESEEESTLSNHHPQMIRALVIINSSINSTYQHVFKHIAKLFSAQTTKYNTPSNTYNTSSCAQHLPEQTNILVHMIKNLDFADLPVRLNSTLWHEGGHYIAQELMYPGSVEEFKITPYNGGYIKTKNNAIMSQNKYATILACGPILGIIGDYALIKCLQTADAYLQQHPAKKSIRTAFNTARNTSAFEIVESPYIIPFQISAYTCMASNLLNLLPTEHLKQKMYAGYMKDIASDGDKIAHIYGNAGTIVLSSLVGAGLSWMAYKLYTENISSPAGKTTVIYRAEQNNQSDTIAN